MQDWQPFLLTERFLAWLRRLLKCSRGGPSCEMRHGSRPPWSHHPYLEGWITPPPSWSWTIGDRLRKCVSWSLDVQKPKDSIPRIWGWLRGCSNRKSWISRLGRVNPGVVGPLCDAVLPFKGTIFPSFFSFRATNTISAELLHWVSFIWHLFAFHITLEYNMHLKSLSLKVACFALFKEPYQPWHPTIPIDLT